MQRRTFMSGLMVLGGALAGNRLTVLTGGWIAPRESSKDFITAVRGINLTGISSEMLLKLLAHQLTDLDRRHFMAQVVSRNRAVFIVDAHSKKFGVPGFYRVIE